MKAHIIFPFHRPAGGGKSFLRSLRDEWCRRGCYAEQPWQADGFLFNSHQDLFRVALTRARYGNRSFIQRVDGPMSAYTQRSDRRDNWAARGSLLADGIIFQSEWSKSANADRGFVPRCPAAVIRNAPDSELFHSRGREPFSRHRPTRLIAASWSANLRKGFEIYRFLDKHLDFSCYHMTFAGNSPIVFKNIVMTGAVSREHLSLLFRQHDIFVTASAADPCSNTVVEALSCGLPVVAYASGGHHELIQNAGVFFHDEREVLEAIVAARDGYEDFQAAIAVDDIADVARQYLDFFTVVASQRPLRRNWLSVNRYVSERR